jgi:sphingomyelin phosphodiesterase
MKAFILVLSSIFFAPVAFAQQELSATLVKKIRILSWNIYMLPGLFGHGKIPRAQAIGELLDSSDYDVIVFQEAFDQKARKTIRRLLQPAFPFEVGPANKKLISCRINSGLWIFSRYPVDSVHSIVFKTRQGIDAMSRKGAVMIDVRIKDTPVQIIVTHLQNSGGDWLRQSQCVELYHRLIKKHERPDVPQLICGDLNINRHDTGEQYRLMLQTLDAQDGAIGDEKAYSYDRAGNDLHVEFGAERDLIDYVLVRPNHAPILATERKILKLQWRWHAQHIDLSDHYSIETELYFSLPLPALTAAIIK